MYVIMWSMTLNCCQNQQWYLF